MTRKVVCAGAQSINYLGPVVKPRDDKKDVIDITWGPWSSHGMTRKVVCAGAQSINYLGPVVKPRDDKKDVIDITWVPWSSHGMTRKERGAQATG